MMAFCSACSPRHSSWRSPEGTFSRSRRQPATSQWVTPEGTPLYPVASRRRSLTRTAPTARRMQDDRLAASFAMSMK
jgi:hypothetical protein